MDSMNLSNCGAELASPPLARRVFPDATLSSGSWPLRRAQNGTVGDDAENRFGITPRGLHEERARMTGGVE